VSIPSAPVDVRMPLLSRVMKRPGVTPVVERLMASLAPPARSSVLTQMIGAVAEVSKIAAGPGSLQVTALAGVGANRLPTRSVEASAVLTSSEDRLVLSSRVRKSGRATRRRGEDRFCPVQRQTL
jgi:hypothetical protein